MPDPIDLLVHHSAEVATPVGDAAPIGKDLGRVTVLERGAVAIDGGRIVGVGTEADLSVRFAPLVEGPLVPHDILRISGEEALQNYLLREVQNVYRAQGVKVNDKHIEIIIARMLRKVQVEEPGDTGFLPGLVSALIYGSLVIALAKLRKDFGPPVSGYTWGQRFYALLPASPVLLDGSERFAVTPVA